MIPKDLRYSKEHEWVKVEGDEAVIGITDFAQEQLGDVVYVELPPVGQQIEQFKSFGVVESVMARFRAEENARAGWLEPHAEDPKHYPVAYFSAEYGLHHSMPFYAGGLGFLAGDFLKAMSDLGAPVAAVRLDKNAAGFRRGRPNVPFSEAPAHRGPRHHTAALIKARGGPRVNH